MSKNVKGPVIRGNVKGLENSQKVAARLIYQKQPLIFSIPAQVWVDEDGNYAPDGGEGCTLTPVEIDYHFEINPRAISPEHTNRCAAIQSHLGQILRLDPNKKGKVLKSELADSDAIVELLQERDEAEHERLIACVVKDASGNTDWDYTDASGKPVNLTLELLGKDSVLAEAMRGAFDTFTSGLKLSAQVDTKPKTATGSADSTPETPTPSSAESDTPSTADEKASPAETDSSPSGSSQ